MNDRDIEDILNKSDFDFSGSEDDNDYLPPEVVRALHQSDDSEEDEEENLTEAEPGRSAPLFWRTKEMRCRGPDIADDKLVAQGTSEMNILYCFFEYLGTQFWEMVAEQSNIYSAQKRDLKSLKTNSIEIIHFAGMQLLMGTLKYPQGKLYWTRDLCVPIIRDTMPRDRFFELRNYLHFVDLNCPDTNDKLWKIRPIINPILKKCHSLPRSKHMSIDEQMIPFAGRCEYRQYVPSKPNPLGLKNFVLAARDGIVLDFEIYVGKDTISPEIMKNLGLGGGIVQTLCRTIESSCVLYTDRFFTSLKLAEHLIANNNQIFLTGTVMTNRIGPVSTKLKPDKELQRGAWDEKVRNDDNICIVKWKDTKAVTLLSTCTGGEPATTCQRWCKVRKEKIDVTQPAVVKTYNTCMGGIDLCDRLIAYYRSSMRTKKWTVRTFCHFLDLVVVNCWLMYMRCCKVENVESKHKLGLLQYRLNLAKALMKYDGGRVDPNFMRPGSRSQSSPGPSAVSNSKITDVGCDEPPAKKNRAVVPHPLPETRLDNVGHLPRFIDSKNASKCRHPTCSSKCRTMCVKCHVFLCILKNNCFESYHSNKNFGPH
ncbi:unnamed protein product [Parnassius mnemosyne]|uniref:PiggyBac transposable element-derived protein domain-containing protein n=1 Tax=Parnassius mnemosyne TaxID=213953 RepID=A0AAV1LJC5_9NEOP